MTSSSSTTLMFMQRHAFFEALPTLTLGDGDLSFSIALRQLLRPDCIFMCTTYEPLPILGQRYPAAIRNRERLLQQSKTLPQCHVHHGIDATLLHTYNFPWRGQIIFNFPHTGGKMNIAANRTLLHKFFASAAQARTCVDKNTRIYLALVAGQGGTPHDEKRAHGDTWQVQTHAASSGFVLCDLHNYEVEQLVEFGYTCVGYRSTERGFEIAKSLMHVYHLEEPLDRLNLPRDENDSDLEIERIVSAELERREKHKLPLELVPLLERRLHVQADHPFQQICSMIACALKRTNAEIECPDPFLYVPDFLYDSSNPLTAPQYSFYVHDKRLRFNALQSLFGIVDFSKPLTTVCDCYRRFATDRTLSMQFDPEAMFFVPHMKQPSINYLPDELRERNPDRKSKIGNEFGPMSDITAESKVLFEAGFVYALELLHYSPLEPDLPASECLSQALILARQLFDNLLPNNILTSHNIDECYAAPAALGTLQVTLCVSLTVGKQHNRDGSASVPTLRIGLIRHADVIVGSVIVGDLLPFIMRIWRISDPRWFWSRDARWHRDWKSTNVQKSNLFSQVFVRDNSFLLPGELLENFDELEFHSILRAICGDCIIRVSLLEHYEHPEFGSAKCFRFLYNSGGGSRTLDQPRLKLLQRVIF